MDKTQILADVQEIFRDVIDNEEIVITPETVADDIEEWDSLAKLSLIVMMDDECGKTVTNDVIKGLKTVKDIMDLMD